MISPLPAPSSQSKAPFSPEPLVHRARCLLRPRSFPCLTENHISPVAHSLNSGLASQHFFPPDEDKLCASQTLQKDQVTHQLAAFPLLSMERPSCARVQHPWTEASAVLPVPTSLGACLPAHLLPTAPRKERSGSMLLGLGCWRCPCLCELGDSEPQHLLAEGARVRGPRP